MDRVIFIKAKLVRLLRSADAYLTKHEDADLARVVDAVDTIMAKDNEADALILDIYNLTCDTKAASPVAEMFIDYVYDVTKKKYSEV